jgi:hypothetical protein
MAGSTDTQALEAEIDRIRSLGLEALRPRWHSMFGAAPPSALTKDWRKSSELFSGESRTGLRRTKTEIGKWRAETAAVKPAAGALEFEDCGPETSA